MKNEKILWLKSLKSHGILKSEKLLILATHSTNRLDSVGAIQAPEGSALRISFLDFQQCVRIFSREFAGALWDFRCRGKKQDWSRPWHFSSCWTELVCPFQFPLLSQIVLSPTETCWTISAIAECLRGRIKYYSPTGKLVTPVFQRKRFIIILFFLHFCSCFSPRVIGMIGMQSHFC